MKAISTHSARWRGAALLVVALVLLLTMAAIARGESLFRAGRTAPQPVVNERGEEIAVSDAPTVRTVSVISVQEPQPRKFNVHDLVTVIIREESSSKSENESEMARQAALKANIRQWILYKERRLIPDEGIAGSTPSIDVSASGNIRGSGEVVRKDSFIARITAEVIDVKPNGILVIEARNFVQMDQERITMTLTGMVRPADVKADNTVNSSTVGNLAVTKKTEGIARDGARHGWLTRMLRAINPI
jgi:flagellar L-ring protein FlgH